MSTARDIGMTLAEFAGQCGEALAVSMAHQAPVMFGGANWCVIVDPEWGAQFPVCRVIEICRRQLPDGFVLSGQPLPPQAAPDEPCPPADVSRAGGRVLAFPKVRA